MPKSQKTPYDQLAHIANLLQTNSSAIRLLGQATDDSLLIHFIATRLDNDTRARWCEDPRSNGCPAEEQFLQFLHERRNVLFQLSPGSEKLYKIGPDHFDGIYELKIVLFSQPRLRLSKTR